ncbi:hypothetical protein ACFY6U_37200 [Streptomyces sp. NPDC013157]|uniref:hypothetical protein n=1 Tax=Streptomyces sp. NPDC013157 TaxID=3364861 RepID=UPI0036C532C8
MTQESVIRQALASFDELPPPEARLLEALAVHQWFTADLVSHTAADLGVAVTPEQVVSTRFVVKDRVPFPVGPSRDVQYGLRSVLRVALHDRMRTERTERYRQSHRIAATYYNQSLDPLRTERLSWYVNEIRHLTACRPDLAVERLAAFAHTALVAGCAEAASRAAAEVSAAPSAADDDQALAGIIEAVAQILNAPAHIDHSTVVLLNDLLTRYSTPAGPAATRLVLLARDLVVHYTERATPATPLTALVAPAATATVDPRGVPVLGGELRLLEDLSHPSRIIKTRSLRVELPSRKVAYHRVTTRLATEDRPGRSPVLADVLPRNNWHLLDSIDLSERGVRPVDVLRTPEAARILAQGLGRLLDPGGHAPGTSGRAELSRRLNSLGWYGGDDELNDLLERTRQSDDVEELLRNRAAELMRYTPVVALLDVYPGLPSEVSYEHQEECAARRDGLGRVVVSIPLTLPLQVRNQLEFVAPDGLVPVLHPVAEGVQFTPVRSERPASTERRYEVQTEPREEEAAARINIELGYRLPDREFRDAARTAVLCMMLSLLPPLILLTFDTSLVVVYSSLIAGVVAAVETPKDGFHQDRTEPLQAYAGKSLRRLRQTNTLVAVAAAAAAAPSIAASVFISGAAFLWCLGTFIVVLNAQKGAERPLHGPSRSGGRTLTG